MDDRELQEFYSWRTSVANDKLTYASTNKLEIRNCKDLLRKLKDHPQSIENYLKDEGKSKSHYESRDYKFGEWKYFSFFKL